jgi:hypothetical protein
MAKIEKFSGIFQNVGDIVQIQVPPDGEAVLRLYQLTKEIALFYIVADPAAVPPVIPVTRFFQASDANTLERLACLILQLSNLKKFMSLKYLDQYNTQEYRKHQRHDFG